MSFLNNMLNDLEKRQATTGAGQSLFELMQLSSPVRRAGSGSILLLGLVIVAAGIGAWVWVNHQKTDVQPPVILVADMNSLPKAKPASVTPVSGSGDVPSPLQAVAVTQAASEAVSKPSGSLTRQAIKPEVVLKEASGTQLVPQAGVTEAGEPPLAMTNEKVSIDSAKVFKRGKASPGSVAESSFKVVSPQQRSDNFYRQALSLLQQSLVPEAQQVLREAVRSNAANHSARQLLAELLVDAGSNKEAEALLRTGLDLAPGHSGFSMALARLQVANGAKDDAIATMKHGLSTAADDAEYHALLAALLQKQGRHAEAVEHYLTALRSNSTMPNWLIGVGISLQAENKMNDAGAAFQRAIDTGELSPEVEQFANGQLKLIRQQH